MNIPIEKSDDEPMEVAANVLQNILKPIFDELQIYLPTEHKVNDLTKHFYDKNVVCSNETARQIFNATTQQSSSDEWHSERKFRISASKAHQISNARKKDTCLNYFFERPFDSWSVRYGKETESIAKDKYKCITKNEIIESGLVISVQKPWLCASPDGIVKTTLGELIVLEIKCPSSCAGQTISVPYISNDQLKKSHQYYTQIQIQLFCCNLKSAQLFVYSDIDFKLINVVRDDDYLLKLVPKLESIYFENILPEIKN